MKRVTVPHQTVKDMEQIILDYTRMIHQLPEGEKKAAYEEKRAEIQRVLNDLKTTINLINKLYL